MQALAGDEMLPSRLRLIMQLRNSGIRDTLVLSAMEQVPREMFVEATFRDHAYDDTALPIPQGQTISQPTVVAAMTQALQLTSRMRVLEIGTGSGYQAAILAKLARRVYTIERHKELLVLAEERFRELGLHNIVSIRGDGSKGWAAAAPFERILVTAAASAVPDCYLTQLAPGGIMVIPVGTNGDGQSLVRISKSKDGEISRETLMAVRFVPLISD
ncbi:MAG: protein-L-isoaspartate(D-aspartate) O-methyltransferase [Alphaproteobacteria bacterium]|nr:protein-L-isoaspartate(D-aspartate) O-methyltransferase [Alphaproteobacteria bacterium]